MKIILLRHEERGDSPDFYTSLTQKGLEKSDKLAEELLKLEITRIYCSPFLRVLQTINEFSLRRSLLVNIEYSLYEYLGPEYLTSNIGDIHDIPWFLPRCNTYYTSVFSKERLKLNESLEDIRNRVNKFVEYLQNLSQSQTDVILLVSHLTTLEIFSEQFLGEKISLNMGEYRIIDI